ncbi:MAG: molybdopterin-dependent oxidoreductase [Thermodesulfovibrionales bacterium]|jgi:NADH dehydrogenase/NADH:ubiquinone oxidoreductase subunit G|nr:molybdopterin-dependent oxidoreductase [Thermodesulfovibrionales bacterium]
MANMVNLKIDGKEIKAPEGTNLIDAAELGGIHIPNLCYLKGLKGIGACRLCLVEIEGMKAPMIACTTKVKEGMVVNTKTEKVQEVRKFVIDLILSMHPLDCMTCTKAGVCNLQQYAYDFEIKESSFTRKKFGFSIDEANPFIKRDPDYCVLCGRCVRVCKDQGTNVLEFMGRGVGSRVATANDKPLQESGCTFCGSCVDVCPVNALLEADRWRKGREWDYDKVNSVCLLCGNGCDITVSTKDGQIMKVNAGAIEGSAERYICAYGRFGFDCIEADNRVTAPMKRVNGELKETTWKDAVETVANALKKAGQNAGFIATAGILNEDALTLKKLATDAVKTKNVDTTASLYSDADTLISGTADLDSADLFMLVDLNPSQWQRVLPALDAVIRKRVNAGARLIVINSSEPKIASVATVNLIENEASALMSLTKALIDKGLSGDKKLASAVANATVSEAVEKAATLYMEAKNPVILSSPAMYQAAANISLLKGVAVSVPVESNAKGVVMMGLTTEGKSYKEMVSGGLNLLYAIGEVPLNKRPNVDFFVVQNSHMTELAKQADVVLPSAAYLEVDGTMVDYLGRLKHVCKAVEPAGEAKSHRDIFVDIANAMGADIKEAKEGETKKLAKVKVKASVAPFARKEGFDVKVDEMIESINASVINGSRLSWLKEASVCA